jgi:hypothetical protein
VGRCVGLRVVVSIGFGVGWVCVGVCRRYLSERRFD